MQQKCDLEIAHSIESGCQESESDYSQIAIWHQLINRKKCKIWNKNAAFFAWLISNVNGNSQVAIKEMNRYLNDH